MRRLRIATRTSRLARWQAERVGALVRAETPDLEIELVDVTTSGDQDVSTPLWKIGGRGIFVKEVQAAVLDGRADVAVHSAKDLPSTPTPGLKICAVPLRADPRDVLVGVPLLSLPPGGRVATGSIRRQAQLSAVRPDLTFVGLRGNIETRLSKVGTAADSVAMAAAAIDRLGITGLTIDPLDPADVLPQVGQGAIAVEARTDDPEVRAAVRRIHHLRSGLALVAERAFLAELGSGCDLPVGALAEVQSSGAVRIEGLIASLDGHVCLRERIRAGGDGRSVDMTALGRDLARRLLEAGGRALLDDSQLAPVPPAGR